MATTGVVTLYNKSTQMLNIALRPPGGDFYRDSQYAYLKPGAQVQLPKGYLLTSQIENLQKAGHLSVIYDSDVHEPALSES